MSTIFRVDKWDTVLKTYGFRPDVELPDAFEGRMGACPLLIKKFCPRNDEKECVVDLSVLYRLEGMDVDAIILNAFLRRSEKPIPFDFGASWDKWKPGEEDSALEALTRFGIPWLEEYSNPEKLIDYFERCLREGIPKSDWKLPFPFKTIVAQSGGEPDSKVRRPPIYHEYLANLYRDIGDLESSLKHAEIYSARYPDDERVKSLIESLRRQQ